MDQKRREAIRSLETYELIKSEELPDIHAEGMLLRHRKTGARVLLLPCEDNNKVFSVGFRTPPKDSTGVAHIIEHSVLCGSRKYPLKDPFVELVKGSLNTFLNAMTFPDKTVYPLASTNEKDFRNLVDVYLDAVFYPNIYREEKIFRQEGWTYHLEKESDPITLNGVVYNEMKGAFSSADDLLERMMFNSLFPDTPYGVESGGDPGHIPDLTYEDFLDFHRTYYHPSNSFIYLYGDMNMAAYLKRIDREYLSRFDYLDVDSVIPKQDAFDGMRSYDAVYPISDQDTAKDKTYLAFSAVAKNPADSKADLAIDVIDHALFSSQGAPVKEALLKAGIGQDVYGTYNDGILQPYYSIVAKGSNPEDKDRFLSTIRKELKKQIKKGIDTKSLLAGINYQEFSYREADFATYPKGLIYGLNALDTWLYDDLRPFEAFKKLAVYEELRREASKKHKKGEKGYFEKLAEDLFLKNPFCSVVALRPEKGLTRKQDLALAEKLKDYKASLTDKEIKDLVKKTRDLLAYQESEDSEEALKSLPSLKRSDLKRSARQLSNKKNEIAGCDVIYHKAVTNGIGYVTILFDAGEVNESDLPLLAFLKQVLRRISTKDHTYQDLDNEIGIHTGGLLLSLSLYDDPDDRGGYRAYLTVRMKAVLSEMKAGFDLIREILTSSDFKDTVRLKELLMETKLQTQMAIQSAGHMMALLRAGAYYSSDGAFRDLTSGIGYYKGLKRIGLEIEERPDFVSDRLKLLTESLVVRSGMTVSFTAEEGGMEAIRKPLTDLIEALPAGLPLQKRRLAAPYGNLKEAFITAGQVQHVAQTGPFIKKGCYSGHQMVLRQLLSFDYLWQNIRVTGGAYGCMVSFTRRGEMNLCSFRDPNLKRTLDVYSRLPKYLASFDANEEAMTKLVIGALGAVDTPLTPSLFDSVCMQAYMNGLTRKDLQKSRDELLDTTAEDIRGQMPLVKEALKGRYICAVGSETVIERDKKLFNHIEHLI